MKDWNDIPDEEFDDAFKDIFLNHSEEVWPDAWPLMEEKLDEENRRRRFLIFWRSAAAIFIFGSIGIISTLYLKKDSLENKTAKIENNSTNTTIQKGNKAVDEVPEVEKINKKQLTNASDFNQTQNSSSSISEINSGSKTKPKAMNKSVSNPKQKLVLARNRANYKIPKKEEVLANSKTNNELITDKFEKQNTIILRKKIEEPSKKGDLTLNENENKTTDLIDSKDNSLANVKKEDEAYFKEDTIIVLTGKTEPQTNQSGASDISGALPSESSKILQKLALNLGFSPDYSKVVASEFGPMGYNLQVILDYKINRKWALRAGVIKSLKLYDAYPEDYAWPVKWGKPSSPLKEVSATCDMLDIPVSLSYQVLEKGPNKLYTSLGITNYKMVNEKYEYFYENNADPNLKWRKWEGSSGFFGAGVVNMSVGLERKLTNFLSVQVEPFVKIPVKNVGFGNVKLFTTGIFLNLKTQAPRKKMQPK